MTKTVIDRIEQGAFRWARENTAKNNRERKRFSQVVRRMFLDQPIELRGAVETALYTAEGRGNEAHERVLRAAAAALERTQVGDAEEATAILEQVVTLNAEYVGGLTV